MYKPEIAKRGNMEEYAATHASGWLSTFDDSYDREYNYTYLLLHNCWLLLSTNLQKFCKIFLIFAAYLTITPAAIPTVLIFSRDSDLTTTNVSPLVRYTNCKNILY